MATLTAWNLLEDQDKIASTGQPKLKFLWNVKFGYRSLSGAQSSGELDDIAFQVKQTTRPSPTIQYRDVNFYNFMTKVATKVDYGTMSLTFYDDPMNNAVSLFGNYIEAVSPIAGNSMMNESNFENNDAGLFSNIGSLSGNDRYSVIQYIELIHETNTTTYNPQKTIYRFANPRATQMTADELDMTSSDASTITLSFNYDAFSVRNE